MGKQVTLVEAGGHRMGDSLIPPGTYGNRHVTCQEDEDKRDGESLSALQNKKGKVAKCVV